MTYEERIAADRMWRDPEARRRFEAETGLTDAGTWAYHDEFVKWAVATLPKTVEE